MVFPMTDTEKNKDDTPNAENPKTETPDTIGMSATAKPDADSDVSLDQFSSSQPTAKQGEIPPFLKSTARTTGDDDQFNQRTFRPEQSDDLFDTFDQEMDSGEQPDDFQSERRFGFFTLIAGVAVLGSLLGMLGIYVLDGTPTEPNFAQGKAPVIRPVEQSKIKPADPGGLKVENTNVAVYDTVSRKKTDKQIQVVESEKPSPPKPQPDTKTTATPKPAVETAKSAQQTTAEKPLDLRKPTTSEQQPAQTAEQPTPHTNAYVAGQYMLQIGSVRSEKGATTQWQNAKSKSKGLLNDKDLRIEKVTITGKGDFYRILAISFPDLKSAKSRCTSLKQNTVDCIVRKIK